MTRFSSNIMALLCAMFLVNFASAQELTPRQTLRLAPPTLVVKDKGGNYLVEAGILVRERVSNEEYEEILVANETLCQRRRYMPTPRDLGMPYDTRYVPGQIIALHHVPWSSFIRINTARTLEQAADVERDRCEEFLDFTDEERQRWHELSPATLILVENGVERVSSGVAVRHALSPEAFERNLKQEYRYCLQMVRIEPAYDAWRSTRPNERFFRLYAHSWAKAPKHNFVSVDFNDAMLEAEQDRCEDNLDWFERYRGWRSR